MRVQYLHQHHPGSRPSQCAGQLPGTTISKAYCQSIILGLEVFSTRQAASSRSPCWVLLVALQQGPLAVWHKAARPTCTSPLTFTYVAVPQTSDSSVCSHGLNIWTGSVLLATWLAVLIVTVVLGTSLSSPPPPLQWWQVFYRTGSIIYGGGQVVLPMLYNDVVQQTCDPGTGVCVDSPNTWVTSKQFYAGKC